MRQLRLPLLISALGLALMAVAAPTGVRLLVAGHSFCVPMQKALSYVAKAAGVTGHELVDTQFIGNSTVTQHWELADEKNIAKRDLLDGKADVLVLSPHTKIPDDAIDRFTNLMLAGNAKGRVLVYESWLPWDGQQKVDDAHRADLHRNDRTLPELLRLHQSYLEGIQKQIRAINKQHGRQVVNTVPVGPALFTLRAYVAAGKVPGITSQDALFTDAMGHPGKAIVLLGAYCEYAVLYRTSPIGITLPRELGIDPALNTLLQRIAWDAVTFDPLTGVTAEKP